MELIVTEVHVYEQVWGLNKMAIFCKKNTTFYSNACSRKIFLDFIWKSLKFVLGYLQTANIKSLMVQVMAQHLLGGKPLPQPMRTKVATTYQESPALDV